MRTRFRKELKRFACLGLAAVIASTVVPCGVVRTEEVKAAISVSDVKREFLNDLERLQLKTENQQIGIYYGIMHSDEYSEETKTYIRYTYQKINSDNDTFSVRIAKSLYDLKCDRDFTIDDVKSTKIALSSAYGSMQSLTLSTINTENYWTNLGLLNGWIDEQEYQSRKSALDELDRLCDLYLSSKSNVDKKSLETEQYLRKLK